MAISVITPAWLSSKKTTTKSNDSNSKSTVASRAANAQAKGEAAIKSAGTSTTSNTKSNNTTSKIASSAATGARLGANATISDNEVPRTDGLDEDGGTYKASTTTFAPSQTYLKAMEYTNQLLSQLSSGRTSYTDKLNDIMNQIENREDFSYDFNADPLFQQSLQSAMQSGKTAMQDTMGQAAALTGGYGSSYGTAVANQAYNASIQEAYDNLPDYYQLAYNKYADETNNLQNQLAMYQTADDTEYNRLANAYSANAENAANIYDQEYNNFWQTQNFNESAKEWAAEMEYQKAQDEANATTATEASNLNTTQMNALKSDLKDALSRYSADSDYIAQMITNASNTYNMTDGQVSELWNYVDSNGANKYTLTTAKNGNPIYQDQYGKVYQGSQSSIGFSLVEVGDKGNSTDNDAVYTDGKGNTLTYAEIVSKGWKKYITSKKVG